jgi:hypothetical protein
MPKRSNQFQRLIYLVKKALSEGAVVEELFGFFGVATARTATSAGRDRTIGRSRTICYSRRGFFALALCLQESRLTSITR